MDECRRLAQAGEEEVKRGNTRAGIDLLLAAINAGTQDTFILSAIYSQLGNAYYAVRDFAAASFYHGNDLLLSQVQDDIVQEMKAMCNLSHALAMNGEIEKAIEHARAVVDKAVYAENAKVYECRGYYALGFVHFQQFQRVSANQEKFDENCLSILRETARCYEECLRTSVDENGKILPGCMMVRNLTLGNLGISYYYLGQFHRARQYYEMRLETAKSVGDRTAQLRTYTNLGNTCVQLGDYESAIVSYTRALVTANRDRRKDIAAQLYFYLGSTEALFGHYKESLANHLAHLDLAKTLSDVAGEARALLHVALCCERLHDVPKALYFFALHWNLVTTLEDTHLLETTRKAVEQMVQRHSDKYFNESGDILVEDCSNLNLLKNSLLDMDDNPESSKPAPSGAFLKLTSLSESLESFISDCAKRRHSSTPKRSRLYEVEEGEAPEGSDCGLQRSSASSAKPALSSRSDITDDPEAFFEFLSRMQGSRIDDQRCAADVILKDRTNNSARQGDSLNRFDVKSEKKGVSMKRRMSKMFTRPFKSSHTSNLFKSSSKPSLSSFKKSGGSTVLADQQSTISSASVNHFALDYSRNSLLLEADSQIVSPEPSLDNASVSQGEPSVRSFSTANFVTPSIATENRSIPFEERRIFPSKNPEDILDLIMNVQGRRMDEQRADPILPGLSNRNDYIKSLSERNDSKDGTAMSERLYEIIMERQSHRLDDQRSELGGRPLSCSDLPECLPDDVSELVITLSAGRIETQRAQLKPLRSESDLRAADDLPVRCASASATVNLDS